ncbi:ring-1,2-phenylacetyl-CoA epoxidase subunit PaaA (plasmid) [Ensifer sp. WSM1721]|uniref:Phenylacetic acid catabolic protein n=1 Tax=Ensifer sp. WSM1721 TaxID=1041159 RepID=UPI000478B86C|nr:Phenylacetic acid catabolic protein [Ensifer sp. WSM1721]
MSDTKPDASDTMPIEDYLAQGGVLTSPDNVPPRYRGELLRLMASFVDSELAGSAGFADVINEAPGIKERIAAARIVLEKADHAGQVLEIMGSFGADTARYAVHHPWSARFPRDADIGAERRGGDMRLSVLHYPLQGWIDAVVMNVLMGKAVVIQLGELARVSYQPLAEVFRVILPREAHHAELGVEGLKRIVETEEGRRAAREAVAYWRPRVAASFGLSGSARYEMLARLGLRHKPNETLLAEWQAAVDAELAALNLN